MVPKVTMDAFFFYIADSVFIACEHRLVIVLGVIKEL